MTKIRTKDKHKVNAAKSLTNEKKMGAPSKPVQTKSVRACGLSVLDSHNSQPGHLLFTTVKLRAIHSLFYSVLDYFC